MAYPTIPAVGQSRACRAEASVRGHGPMVGEVTLASRARLASPAACVESRFQFSPAMSEFCAWFVSSAGGASVWPRFWGAIVAHPATFRAFPQLAALECFVARAASAKGILVLELTRAADDGSRREVPQLALLFASGA